MLFYNTFTLIFLIFFDMFLTEKSAPDLQLQIGGRSYLPKV